MKEEIRFKGSFPALVTPMKEDQQIDFDAYAELLEWHVQEGSDGLVVVGTTGESVTLTEKERYDLIDFTVKEINGRIPIIAGAGTNSTQEAIKQVQKVSKLGVDGILSVTPYYNKPTQEGLYQHFKALAQSTETPIILYNVPGRTAVSLSNETLLRLAELPHIVGLKDATGDLMKGADFLSKKPETFQVLSGDDASAAQLILMGAQGNISVVGNVAPRLMHELCQAALDMDVLKVRQLSHQLSGLSQVLFCQSNPIPVKWALARMGKIGLSCRLPLTVLEERYHISVESALQSLDLLK